MREDTFALNAPIYCFQTDKNKYADIATHR